MHELLLAQGLPAAFTHTKAVAIIRYKGRFLSNAEPTNTNKANKLNTKKCCFFSGKLANLDLSYILKVHSFSIELYLRDTIRATSNYKACASGVQLYVLLAT